MKPLPTIGFDRYVPRHWLDAALAVAAGEIERGAVPAGKSFIGDPQAMLNGRER